MQITLDLSNLSKRQLTTFVSFVESFLDNSPHFTPTFDELPEPPADVVPKTRKSRKASPSNTAGAVIPAPAAPGAELQQAYCDLVGDITRNMAAGNLTYADVEGCLGSYGVEHMPALGEKLDLVPRVREALAPHLK